MLMGEVWNGCGRGAGLRSSDCMVRRALVERKLMSTTLSEGFEDHQKLRGRSPSS